MAGARQAAVAVVLVGSLWGLYWLPLRRLDALTAAGAWTTMAVLLVAVLALGPAAWRGRARLRAAPMRAHVSVALGGAAFVLYSDALLSGQVAVVILLFYLTPVWSTLIARFWLRRAVPPWRYAAIACGLIGIACVLRGSHGGLPLPQASGDWLGLASGLLWSIASTGIHGHSRTRALETNFVFCLGGLLTAALLAPLLAGLPPVMPAAGTALAAAIVWLLVIGLAWWALSLALFIGAAQRLEPTRVGILLMSEVVVGALSAAWLSREPFGPLVALGALLVVVAGVLEALAGRGPAADAAGGR